MQTIANNINPTYLATATDAMIVRALGLQGKDRSEINYILANSGWDATRIAAAQSPAPVAAAVVVANDDSAQAAESYAQANWGGWADGE